MIFIHLLGFPGGSVVKNPPAMQETRVQSLGQEDPLEKEMATHSNILVENPMYRGAQQATVHGVAKDSDMTQKLSMHTPSFKDLLINYVRLTQDNVSFNKIDCLKLIN